MVTLRPRSRPDWRSTRGRSTWSRGLQSGGILVRIKRRGLADRRWPGALHSLPRTLRSDPRGAVGPPRPRRRGHRLTRTTTRTLRCCSGLGGLAVARASGATAGRPSSLHDAPILARPPCCPSCCLAFRPSGAPVDGDPRPRPKGAVSPTVNLNGASVHRSSPWAGGNLQEGDRHADARRAGGASPGAGATRRVQRLGPSVGHRSAGRGRQRTGRAGYATVRSCAIR